MNVLFLCTANIHRSRTAEDYFRVLYAQHTFRSAGLSEKECERHGSTLCTVKLLEWADVVYVFEPRHKDRIQQYTGDSFLSKIECLDIEDIYQYIQPELISKLEGYVWPFAVHAE